MGVCEDCGRILAVGSAVGPDTDLGFLVSAAGFEWSLMIAVTMGFGEPFGRLAALAARAVREMTGLETVVLDGTHFAASGLPHPHHLKLRIFDHVDDDAVLYFDQTRSLLSLIFRTGELFELAKTGTSRSASSSMRAL